MTLAAGDFDYIRALVRRESAIVLEPGKEYLVESRLNPLARQVGVASIADLVHLIQRGESRVVEQVVDAMTTNETSFFRDVHPFEALRARVVPGLTGGRCAGRFDVWCGASSSGQEPYSIAMVLRDALPPGFQGSILATDISQQMLARTQEGRYSQLEVNRGLPAAALVQHFDRCGTDWQVRRELRAMIRTRALNLNVPLPLMGPFDVVFLRNVLIYFDTPTKTAVLQQVRRVIKPDGFLFLGGAESTLTLDDAWERVVLDRATAYRLRDPLKESR